MHWPLASQHTTECFLFGRRYIPRLYRSCSSSYTMLNPSLDLLKRSLCQYERLSHIRPFGMWCNIQGYKLLGGPRKQDSRTISITFFLVFDNSDAGNGTGSAKMLRRRIHQTFTASPHHSDAGSDTGSAENAPPAPPSVHPRPPPPSSAISRNYDREHFRPFRAVSAPDTAL